MDVNTSVKLNVAITDINGVAADPDTLAIEITSPSHDIGTYTYASGTIVKSSTGNYYIVYVPDESGVWHYEWQSVNPIVVQTGYFNVEQTVAEELARTSMRELVQEVRALTNAGRNDYTLEGWTWWTDAQIQDVLDNYSEDVKYLQLDSTYDVIGGTTYYYDYYIPTGEGNRWERTGSESKWAVVDWLGGTVSEANYSVNWYTGKITFTADTGGSAYYLHGTRFSLNSAVAEIWQRKAAHLSDISYDITLDGHKLSRSQRADLYMSMADKYSAKAGFVAIPVIRSDIVGV